MLKSSLFIILAFGFQDSKPSSAPALPPESIQLREVAPATAGIDFVHHMGGSGEKFIVETMGSGVAVFDADGDGHLDIYFPQGAPMPGAEPFDARSKLYLGSGDWKFRDVTENSGCANAGYAMGVAVADMNNDGKLDMYVSAYGRGHLYINEGNARFVDTTEKSKVLAEGFLSSAVFGDLDNDGLVDLYVANYLNYEEVKKNPFCGKHAPGGRAYCSPHAFTGGEDYLYKNLGSGVFADVSKQTGVARASKTDGKGLGVVMSDFDFDGDLDIAVANDSCANFLYQNDGNWKFTEIGAVAGVAFAEDGHERAGMGIDAADVDGDQRPDIFITNLSSEPNSLFCNIQKLMFDDRSGVSGLGPPAVPFVGFGCGLVDFDGDGDRDAIVVNGHILDNPELFGDISKYRQRPLVFENNGKGKFKILSTIQPFLQKERVLRGLAFGDIDGDGRVDAIATPSEGPPVLLKNESSPKNGRIALRFKASRSNAAAIGLQLNWLQGGVRRYAETRTGFSYLSASDASLAIGCGESEGMEQVQIRWPSGSASSIARLKANRTYELSETGEVKDLGSLRDR